MKPSSAHLLLSTLPRLAAKLALLRVMLAPAAAAAASFQGLGPMTGVILSEALAVSGDGLVVVGQDHSNQAARWTAGGGVEVLGLLPGDNVDSAAFAVSGDGSVVVGRSRDLQRQHAFSWTRSGGMVGLEALPGDTDTVATAVSADGSVMAGSSCFRDPPFFFAYACHAARWTATGGVAGLGSAPGRSNSDAFGISADGSVVVGDSYNASGSDTEAFRWTAANGMLGLGLLPGGTWSRARAVSPDGSVVFGVGDSSAAPGGQLFRWSASNGMVGVAGTALEGTSPEAFSVDGSVVVGISSPFQVQTGAFVWDATNGLRDIATLLANTYGLDITGWTLRRAMGVSSDGLTIVGTGINPDGSWQGWIARLGSGSSDSDSDGIPDDSDNCPFAANGGQTDTGGVGLGSAPDGIGDACQCGDVNGDGRVTIADATVVQRSLLVPPTATPAAPDRCDVNGSSTCSIADAVTLRRALLVPATAAIQQGCAPALP